MTIIFASLYGKYRILIFIKSDIGWPANKWLTINFRQNRIKKECFTSICARNFILNSQVFIEEKNILSYVE